MPPQTATAEIEYRPALSLESWMEFFETHVNIGHDRFDSLQEPQEFDLDAVPWYAANGDD